MEAKGKIRIALGMTAVLLMAAAVATAQLREGLFQIDLHGPEEISWNRDLNSGYASMWYRYPQAGTTQPLPWWNEWFWNDPYIRPGGKWIDVSFNYKLLNPNLAGDVFVTINWTNGQWVGRDAPPTWSDPPAYDPELYIERLTDPEYNLNLDNWRIRLPAGSLPGSWSSGRYWLPIDYNPEWVSVDVRGDGNVGIWSGVILHECVPEPTTLALLAIGSLAAIRGKKA